MGSKKIELTDELIDKLTYLSKLEFSNEDKSNIKKDLDRILGFIEKLDELDTNNIDPLIFMTDEKNILRADIAKQTITQKEALKNAPQKDSDYFKAPKVLNK